MLLMNVGRDFTSAELQLQHYSRARFSADHKDLDVVRALFCDGVFIIFFTELQQ